MGANRKNRLCGLSIALSLTFVPSPAPAGNSPTPTTNPAKDAATLTAEVDKLFAEWDKADSPGCALAVVKDGRIIYEKGYGQANLEYAVPITPTTVFHVASVSKQFTAAAVIMLAQQGKLSLDDDIHKYIPELQDFGKTITPRHLIHHISGLRDQWELLTYAGWRIEDVITQRDVLDMLFQQRELNFAPGDRFLYCNSGYSLLALLVERTSGQTLANYCHDKIFEPLGMHSTHFHDDYQRVVPNRAYSYDPREGGGFRHAVLNFGTVGATSLFTTVEDLARWDQNFYDATVGGKSLIEEMVHVGKLNNGKELDYAGGLTIGKYRGLPTVAHNGVDAGFRSVILRFPAQHFSVIVLANLGRIAPPNLARKIADLYLADQMQPATAPAPVPPATTPAPVPPTTAPATPVDTDHYDDYTGDFYSPELNVVYQIRVQAGRLLLRHRKDEQPLVRQRGDDFQTHYDEPSRVSDEYIEVHFTRDAQGTVTGFTIDGDRVKHLRFSRIQLPTATQPAEPPKPASRTTLKIQGWTIQVDDRLWQPPNETTGRRALQLLEAKLALQTIWGPIPGD